MDNDLLIFLNTENDTDVEKNLDFFDTNYSEKIKFFHTWIYKLHDGGLTYLEALVNFCDEHDVEYEKITKYISPDLKQRLYEESVKLNLIKKSKEINEYSELL